ncbi:hypothetical protein OG735_40255 [Streptomyces sp. NBC_01210]|uniref:hypothetical protein n=1 Tax=Streptomyces sp. NBC_01210 TaxID=2903774 RepID=UPI002E0FB794|nr:hypothetical protein OG735_40255 [Streptomyces sp. NBC_01210]
MSDAYSPIPELNLLKELEERIGVDNISPGFYLTDFGDTASISTWSKDSEFLDSLLSFANANASNSIYALWRIDRRADLATLPVVVFGDEGGIAVVSRNLRDLFQQLGCNRSITVGDYSAGFSDDEDDEDEQGPHAEYLAWLRQHLDLTSTPDPNALVVAAEKEVAVQFANWVGRFIDDEDFVEDFLHEIAWAHKESDG